MIIFYAVVVISSALVFASAFVWILRQAETMEENRGMSVSDAWWRDFARTRDRLLRRDEQDRLEK